MTTSAPGSMTEADERRLLGSVSFVVDTSEMRPVHVLLLPSGTPVRVSPSGYALLKAVSGGESLESLSARAQKKSGARVSRDDLAAAYRALLVRLAAADARP